MQNAQQQKDQGTDIRENGKRVGGHVGGDLEIQPDFRLEEMRIFSSRPTETQLSVCR